MANLIITHKNCIDGRTSQAVFRKRNLPDSIYFEMAHADFDPKNPQYKQTVDFLSKFNKDHIYMADFCLPLHMIQDLLRRDNSIYILDHHASAFPTIDALETMQDENPYLPITIFCSRDNHYSGSKLTWLYFFAEEETPLVIEYVSDGDTWKHKYLETKYLYAAMGDYFGGNNVFPNELLDAMIVSNPLTQLIVDKGSVLHDKFLTEVQHYHNKAELKEFHGYPCYFVQAPKHYTSELGHQLAHACKGIALIYQVEDNGSVYCSLRSIPDIFVNEIAEIYNGGGHEHASAFRFESVEQLHTLFQND